jgi:hypothetical protein
VTYGVGLLIAFAWFLGGDAFLLIQRERNPQ